MHPIAQRVLAGDVSGVARACRMADDRVDGYVQMLKDLYPYTGKAWVVGVTGNPGAGKSTVTDRLIGLWRQQGQRVAVVAVDPSSPFSGGAILGDRIRMQGHFEDSEVFIRSLATRGALGGLSRSATDVVRVLDAWGADVVIVETVGVGQDELEVTRAAHSTLVVVAPGLGDDVQAAKAGILECADVFAVNKADRQGADATMRDLELMVAMGKRPSDVRSQIAHGHCEGTSPELDIECEGDWAPPVVRCIATEDQGIDELAEWLARHRHWLQTSDRGRCTVESRFRMQMETEIRNALLDAALRDIGDPITDAVSRVSSRVLDPYTACETLVSTFRNV